MNYRNRIKLEQQIVSTETGLAATIGFPSARPVGGEMFLLTAPFMERPTAVDPIEQIADDLVEPARGSERQLLLNHSKKRCFIVLASLPVSPDRKSRLKYNDFWTCTVRLRCSNDFCR
jgi:hypothetical protein